MSSGPMADVCTISTGGSVEAVYVVDGYDLWRDKNLWKPDVSLADAVEELAKSYAAIHKSGKSHERQI